LFNDLSKLKWGDEVIVHAYDQALRAMGSQSLFFHYESEKSDMAEFN